MGRIASLISAAAVRTLPRVQNAPAPRLFFVDNLRWLMIVLVVAMHAAVTYSGLGSWYYVERTTLDRPTLVVFAMFQTIVQAFFMGLLFLIAGYFVPAAFDRKGAGRFLRDRGARLGLPTLLYMLAIQPVLVYGMLGWYWNPPTRAFLPAYARYLGTERVLRGSGPLWFALALLFFCAVYALVRLARRTPAGAPQRDGPLPRNAHLAWLALGIALAAFLIRLVQPIGTAVLNMQLCFFSSYAVLFVVGLAAYRNNWLLRLPTPQGMRWLKHTFIAGSLVLLGIVVAEAATGKGDFAAYRGGLHWHSALYALWESFVAVGLCLGFIVWFRDRFNRQGPAAKFLSDNAFAVYVWHAPVVNALAVALSGVHWHPLLKFLLVTVAAIGLSLLLAHYVVRRLPGLRRIM